MCNIKILKIHLCGANFNTLRFLTQRYCFFGLDTFPLVHVLAIVSATSMQSPMNGNLTYLHSLHFHFCPLFCGVGTKLWNILALSHAKTLGPTNFFRRLHILRGHWSKHIPLICGWNDFSGPATSKYVKLFENAPPYPTIGTDLEP